MKLRDLKDGQRFVLCRTGQRFEVLCRGVVKNRLRCFLRIHHKNGKKSLTMGLHHSCKVKPLFKLPEIKRELLKIKSQHNASLANLMKPPALRY